MSERLSLFARLVALGFCALVAASSAAVDPMEEKVREITAPERGALVHAKGRLIKVPEGGSILIDKAERDFFLLLSSNSKAFYQPKPNGMVLIKITRKTKRQP